IRQLPTGGLRVVDCSCLPPGRCHVDFAPGGGVTCVGQCPEGQICQLNTTTNPDGSVDFECKCTPLPCGPDPSGQRCNPVQCPQSDQQCVPTKVRFDPATGQVTILSCDCRSPNECRVEILPGLIPHCKGACPSGQACRTTIVQNPNGTMDISCDCEC